MDYSKISFCKKTWLILSIVLAGLVIGESVSAYDWRSLTSFDDARRMRVINDTLFVATSGGLLAITNPGLPGVQYTNLDGLGTTDLTDIIEDNDGQKWITGNGRLIRFDGLASQRYPIIDNNGDPFRLICVCDDGDYLWLGSDQGLILFSKVNDGGQIQDAFQLFDDLNPAPTVYDIELHGDSIWLATSAGLAGADRSNLATLKSPANWHGYGMDEYPELGTENIRAVRWFEGHIYIGAETGLFRLDPVADSLALMTYPGSTEVHQLNLERDSLFIYSDVGLGVVVDGVASSLLNLTYRAQSGTTYGGHHWMGAVGGGIFHDGNIEYGYTGLPDNDVADVAVTPDGLLAVLFRTMGPYEWYSGEWLSRPTTISSGALAMQSDRYGQFYVGTFGAGMSRVGDTVVQFTTTNSTFQEAGTPGSGYVVCYDVKVTDDYFFGVNFEPRDGTRLVIADLDRMDNIDGWMALGVSDGINGEQMVSVDTYEQAVAVGSGLNGVYYYYYGADPFDPADDNLIHYYQAQSNFRYRIISDVIRVVRFSPKGELWVGTNYGISRFDPGFEMFVEVDLPSGFGPDITAIEFDGRGNVWVGVKNGLVRIDALTGEAEGFTTANSGLLNDYVFNLTFDPNSGDMYVATKTGLSVVESTIGRPTESLDSVYAFPNPYIINSLGDRLSFNFAEQAVLRIFNVAGELVADRPEPVWDGRNDHGKSVASGVYLFVLTNAEGRSGRGKFLLIRN
ncbi:MAG: hypothetical protein J7J98_03685 [candidate division Zixibacteria bacterium]|nr:hypothetical protein [candidate division Zixibacteria bacterium]